MRIKLCNVRTGEGRIEIKCLIKSVTILIWKNYLMKNVLRGIYFHITSPFKGLLIIYAFLKRNTQFHMFSNNTKRICKSP